MDDERPEVPETPRRQEDGDEFPGLDEMIGSFLSEPSLWPVLIVILGSSGAFGAAALVLTIVDRNPLTGVALLLLGGMSVDLVFRSRRTAGLGNIAKLVLLIWTAAIILAGIAAWAGLATG
jgi:type IV secretory pathway VirB2 component (pilin)